MRNGPRPSPAMAFLVRMPVRSLTMELMRTGTLVQSEDEVIG
jgi:hypothetical protein